jgi:hypothetical protein
MALKRKAILAALAGAVLLPGCATGTHYGYGYPYDYGHYDRYGYYYDNPVYVDPAYIAPPLGLGPAYPDHDRRYRHGDRRTERRAQESREPAADPRAEAARRYVERAQRGDFDETTPHPLSKHYSGG